MKKKNLLIYFVIAFIFGVVLYQKGYILKNYEDISPNIAYKRLKTDQNITLIDVRTKKEVIKDGKIENSLLVPLGSLKNSIMSLSKLKNRKIFVYCRSGHRSSIASRILSNNGFVVYNIEGGINRWKREKLPIVFYK